MFKVSVAESVIEICAEVVMFILVCSIAALNSPTAKRNVDFDDRRDFKLAVVGLLADKNYSQQLRFDLKINSGIG